MILLEFGNRIIADILRQRHEAFSESAKSIEVTVADFDGVTYNLTNPGKGSETSIILVSIRIRCFSVLEEHGAASYLKSVYGDAMVDALDGYNVTLSYSLDSALSEDKIAQFSLLKRNCYAGLFKEFFESQTSGGQHDTVIVPFRSDETMYISQDKDRVTVVFSTLFKDNDDVILGRIFLQEFREARRSMRSAPQVLFTEKDPPAELRGTNAASGDNVSYVTFVLESRHVKGDHAEKTIDMIHMFRNYLHYHIKCSKAYLHSKMRARCASLLQVLNRARPEPDKGSKQMKTISGKTFTRKV